MQYANNAESPVVLDLRVRGQLEFCWLSDVCISGLISLDSLVRPEFTQIMVTER
jgi:hypothetical protein